MKLSTCLNGEHIPIPKKTVWIKPQPSFEMAIKDRVEREWRLEIRIVQI